MQAKMAKDQAANMKPPTLTARLEDITLFSNDPNAQQQLAALFNIQLGAPVPQKTDGKLANTMLKGAMDAQNMAAQRQHDMSKAELQAMTKVATQASKAQTEIAKMKTMKESDNAVQES